ncbi:MAG: hypothetical protein ABEJ72_09070, partial [Candidatus Aenigmatarchaeota archaeon]
MKNRGKANSGVSNVIILVSVAILIAVAVGGGYLAATSGNSSGGGKEVMSFVLSGNEEIGNIGTNVGDVAPNFVSEKYLFSIAENIGNIENNLDDETISKHLRDRYDEEVYTLSE